MYFQDIGGTEILAVARHDTVGGEEVVYTPVDNLKNVKLQFNPLNLMMSTRLDTLFNQFAIDINRKVTNLNVRNTPDEGNSDGETSRLASQKTMTLLLVWKTSTETSTFRLKSSRVGDNCRKRSHVV